MSKKDYLSVPRFVTRKWTRGLGLILMLAGGVLAALMFWSLPGEKDIVLAIITVLFGLLCVGFTLAGLRIMLSRLDRIRFSSATVEIRLFGIPLKRIPSGSISSVVGNIREYSSGLKDYQIYTFSINYYNAKGREKSVLMERTAASDEAVSKYLSHVTILI